VEYNEDNDGNVRFYKKGDINKDGDKFLVKVWDKRVFSDKSREKEIQNRTNGGRSTEGWDKISNIQVLNEIDCNRQMYQVLSLVHYDKDGNVMYSSSYDEPEWKYITPDSTKNTLRKEVCK
jgi:hypothetical protein